MKKMQIVREKNVIDEFCTGCGLCGSIVNVKFYEKNGFSYPFIETKEQLDFCKQVCPAYGEPMKNQDPHNVWGKNEEVYLGYSLDNEIRNAASSGGVLTSLCIYLIENGVVDGIIQTMTSDLSQIDTQTVISRSATDVRKCMGSRYTSSMPLSKIKQLLISGEKYAFVGKPCDVAALRQYMKYDKSIESQILYVFSFFCAGEPSKNANEKLLSELGCSEENCVSLKYRGDGWPGFATAISKDNNISKLSYDESWGNILGRDLRKCCRFCMDGIGELADISCGDAWYLNQYGEPDFSEKDGRNVVFARTEKGRQLCLKAQSNYIKLEKYNNYLVELPEIQRYQYNRRITMKPMLAAMKIFAREIPNYDNNVLKQYALHNGSKIVEIRRFLGICKRIVQKKL